MRLRASHHVHVCNCHVPVLHCRRESDAHSSPEFDKLSAAHTPFRGHPDLLASLHKLDTLQAHDSPPGSSQLALTLCWLGEQGGKAVVVVIMEFCDMGTLLRAITKQAFKPHGKWKLHTTYVSPPLGQHTGHASGMHIELQ